MKKIFKMFVLLIMLMISGHNCYAASTETKAVKAYDRFLSKRVIEWSKGTFYKTSDMSFDCKDMNHDGIPELVVECTEAAGTEGFQRIYTYFNGKVKKLWISGNCIYADKYYSKKSILVAKGGRMGDYYTDYYKVYRRKMVLAARYAEGDRYDKKGNIILKNDNIPAKDKYYNWKNKEVSKKIFQKKIKNLLKNAKFQKIKLVNNTEINRNKLLR